MASNSKRKKSEKMNENTRMLIIIAFVGVLLVVGLVLGTALTGKKTKSDNIPVADTYAQNQAQQAATNLTLGKYNTENEYHSDFIGLTFTKPDDWSYHSGQLLRRINKIDETTDDEQFRVQATHLDIFFDMFAVGSNGMDNVQITLEKNEQQTLDGMDVASELNALAGSLKTAYERIPYTNITQKVTDAEIAGRSFKVLEITADIEGIPMYQSIFAVKCEGYLAQVSVITYEKDTRADLLGRVIFTK